MPSTKKSYSKTEILGAYQILGGILGLIVVCLLIGKLAEMGFVTILFICIILSFYFYSIFCGALIFRNESLGLKHSMINQLFQLIGFSLWGITFGYISGIGLTADLDFTMGFDIHLSLVFSNFQFFVDRDTLTPIFRINIIALFIIVFIIRQRKKLKKQLLEEQLLEFGQ